MSDDRPNVNPQQILDHLWSARAAMALAAGIDLGVFTHIENGKHTLQELARAAKASVRGIRILLDALVGLGYLTKKGDRYLNAEIAARFLIKGRQPYFGGLVNETRMTWAGWAKLPEVVKTGRPIMTVDDEAGGKEFFPQLVEAIFPMSYGAAQGAAQAIPKKTRERLLRILDVAAGSGAWSLAFAQATPDARVTVVDYPEVTPVARRFTAAFGVAERYDYLEGNLRTADFGRDRFDLVILGHIIHSEGEKWGRKLIKKAYRALAENGLLLIAEMVPNDTRTGPPFPLLFGLNMLVHTEAGDVFTMREYRAWLKEAGFRKVQTLDVPGPSPLILATK